MKRCFPIVFLGLVLTAAAGRIEAQENWPRWRGPAQDGTVESTGLPVSWGPNENILWETELPSWSAATPIIWGERIFIMSPSKAAPREDALTTREEEPAQGQRRRARSQLDPGGPELLLLCLSKKDGSVLWQRELDNKNQVHRKQNEATPSPVTDGSHVWAMTGTGVIAAFDMNGKEIWKTNLQEEYGTFGLNWGYGSSPLLFEGNLVVEVLHGMKTDDPSYVVCFDAASGKVRWRQERPTDAPRESPDAYTTPVLHEYGGKKEIIISGADYVTGHDPATGAELWRAAGLNPEKRSNYRIVGTPIVVGDIIVAPTRKKPLLGLRAGGRGDITDSHLVWTYEGSGTSDVPSPVSDGTYLYIVEDRGMVTCLDVKTGEELWGPLETTEGIVSASPLLSEGKLYILNERAVTTVVEVGQSFKILSSNELDGSYTLASPAVSGKRLYIRTSTHLYCIGD